MFIYSFKMNKTKLIAGGIIATGIIVGSILLINALVGNQKQDVSDNPKDYIDTPITQTTVDNKIENNEKIESDIYSFLTSYKWEISEKPIDVKQVIIPSEFNETYINYNEIQKSQGYDLTKYYGETVFKYSYEVKNYPKLPNFIRANVLVHKNEIIGGDICSISINGFMHGFELKEKSENTEQEKQG